MAYEIYRDIAGRTNGEIYIGVVGPVRTGKSTFITNFMQKVVLPNIADGNVRQRATDELPQSADGRTIMTTQPKFVPAASVEVKFDDAVKVKMKMIDCVGYMVEGAMGGVENDKPRMVRTPWSDAEMPFDKAAEIGTQKVIAEHSTIGVVMTTDGTITDLPRGSYISAEERVVRELQEANKPFVILLNSAAPEAETTQNLRRSLEEKYNNTVLALNVKELSEDKAKEIIESVLMEFPLKRVDFDMPKWMYALTGENEVIASLLADLKEKTRGISRMKHFKGMESIVFGNDKLCAPAVTDVDLSAGRVRCKIDVAPEMFYEVLSEETGEEISDDFRLLAYVKGVQKAKKQYDKMKEALDSVYETGYGVVNPQLDEMTLEEPEIIKHGSRFGVRLKASAPSLHIMRVDINTEVNPVVGSEQQSEELVKYLMSEFEGDKNSLWDTNMFGKPLSMLVKEGLSNKLHSMPVEAQKKMRRTLGKIVNEGKGGMICILL